MKAQSAAIAPGVAGEKRRSKAVCHTFRFVHLPVSAGGPIVAVSTLFVKAAKCRFAMNMYRLENKCHPRMSQLKTAGTQKRSPFPPAAGHPPFPPSQKIRNGIEPLLGGKGAPFYSTFQLSRRFKMLSASLNGGFSGTSFVCVKLLPQSCKVCALALNRHGGSVEPP